MFLLLSFEFLNNINFSSLMGYAPSFLLGAGIAFIISSLLEKKPKNQNSENLFDAVNIDELSLMAFNNSNKYYFIWPETDDGFNIGNPDGVGDKNALSKIKKLLGYLTNVQNTDTDNVQLIRSAIDKSPEFAENLKQLRENGKSFDQVLRGIKIEGMPIGANAFVSMRPTQDSFGAIGTMAIPTPVWKIDHEGKLVWANSAFLEIVEKDSIESAINSDVSLDKKCIEDGIKAISGHNMVDTRAINAFGERKPYRILISPTFDGAMGMAFDISDEIETSEILKREAKAHTETLNHLNEAVAVFDASRRLNTYNHAFAKLWGIEHSWLDEQPSHEELLDRLRSRSRLPHQGNYLHFKESEIAHYKATSAIPDETWTLPDGRIMRVMRQRQPTGGLLVLFEDISDKALLQAQFKTQIEVQRSTLDKLNEGIAVFSSDGKLALANKSFCDIWNLDYAFIDERAEFGKIYRIAKNQYDNDEFWIDLEARICDPSPNARQETQGEIKIQGGKTLVWLTRPLPDGATLVAFTDITVHEEMEKLLREKADALAEADNLKTSFLEKVSYQLRTPLNTIKGYTDFLLQGFGGELNQNQTDYIENVKSASDSLEKMVNDLLDLAMIDAGQAPLDLGDVNIEKLFLDSSELARTKVTDAQVLIDINCPPDVGLIRADEKRIRQIMINLIDNAMRNCKEGDNISLSAIRIEDTVDIIVSAPNHNFNPKLGAMEFEAFTEGTKQGGLGLVLVKKFIELHGGWLSMKNKGNIISVICHFHEVPKQSANNPELEF